MKILYIPTTNIPIIHWRVESYACELVKNKDLTVHVEYVNDPRDNQDWTQMLFNYGDMSKHIQETLLNAVKYFDVLIFQRIQNMQAIALLSKYKIDFPEKKILVELDDCVGEVALDSTLPWKEHHRWAMEQIAWSDGVIVSTQYLKDSILKLLPHKKIHIAPNCINPELWKTELNIKSNDRYQIGYVGGASHDQDLRIAYRGLKPILDTQDDFKFVIRSGGCRPSWLEDHPLIDFQRVDWHISKFPQEIANLNLDIGIAPLRDSEFNRCKSNIKYLEMASVGVPLVASNVVPYQNEPLISLSSNNANQFAQTILERLKQPRNTEVLLKDHLEKYNISNETKRLTDFLSNL